MLVQIISMLGGQRIMRGEKEGKNREKRRDIQACQFVITKPVMR